MLNFFKKILFICLFVFVVCIWYTIWLVLEYDIENNNSFVSLFFSESETSIEWNYVPWEFIVKFRDNKTNLNSCSWNFILNKYSLFEEFDVKKNIFSSNKIVLKLNDENNFKQKLKELQNDPNVEYVQPNFVYKLQDILPNDEFFSEQWWLFNTWQNIEWIIGISGSDVKRLDAMKIWSWKEDISVPGVLVAVIDDWIYYDHPDLSGQFRSGYNCLSYTWWFLGDCKYGYDFYDMDKDPLPKQGDTHGTHVAGVIWAKINNEIGVVWINPGVKIMWLRVASGSTLTTIDVVGAISFAKHNGAKIINASWWGWNSTCESVFDLELYNAIKSFSWLVVAAAGNEGKEHLDNRYSIPADYNKNTSCWTWLDNVISVAASNNKDQLAGFSDYWLSIDLAAPGKDIGSTVYTWQYAYMDWTSMATPFVVGAFSLAQSFRPDLSYIEIKDILLDTAKEIPTLSGYLSWSKRLDIYSTLYELDNYSPSVPEFLYPLSGSNMNSWIISFSWSNSIDKWVGLSGYYIQFSTWNDFGDILTWFYVFSTWYDVEFLKTGFYYRRVYAFDQKYNTGNWSEINTFFITYTPDVTPPSNPIWIFPSSFSSHFRGSLSFVWGSSVDTWVGILWYVYEILSWATIISWTTINTWVTIDLDSWEYSRKVKSFDYNLNYSEYSDFKTFSVLWDISPNTIDISSITDAEQNVLYTSNIVILSGINTGVLISVNTGFYQINTWWWTGLFTTWYAGDFIQLALTSSVDFSTDKEMILSYWDKEEIFNVTTRAKKNTPIGLNFTSVNDAELQTLYTSNFITVAGLEMWYIFMVSSTTGELIKNGINVGSLSTWIENGDIIAIRLVSSFDYNTSVDSLLSIWSGSATYVVTTKSAPSWWWGGWGWWWGIIIPVCELEDLICIDGKYEEADWVNCRNWELGESCEILTWDENEEIDISSFDRIWDISNSTYSSELNLAYLYAYNMWITTMDNIFDANMEWNLIRSHMAKMLVEWAQNVMWLHVNTEIVCDFDDINGLQGQDLYDFVIQSCQMWLMWLDDQWYPADSFRPSDIVTRAQFATVLSRALWGDKYNNETFWYKNHLSALNEVEIMTKINNPFMQEIRWRVMLMLMRSNDKIIN